MSKARWIGVTLFVLPLASVLWSQTSQARITGRVIDPDGAAIPAADVVAINEETGVSTRSQTNEAGIYVLPFLQPGRYTITATIAGFKKY